MDEDRFNIALRKFLKQVGVTSQREIEKAVREGGAAGKSIRVKMVLTSEDVALNHVVEDRIELE
jgi:ribosome-associated protein YbcJ (S4-like RNA binding protein)